MDKDKLLYGSKGFALMQMESLGLPVPPYYILNTSISKEYNASGVLNITEELKQAIEFIEEKTGKKFAANQNPLFVSVRSGAPYSMPGMMETVLNVATYEALHEAVLSVLQSWHSERAVFYRTKENIPHDVGTAVIIQAMVFGNKNDNSATGVAFTRNPITGENKPFGEYMPNAQGEMIVSGTHTPQKLSELEKNMPDIYQNLMTVMHTLEKYFKDMQELEFTIEDGKLWMLQARSGKRAPVAAFKIAVDMMNEGLVSEQEILKLIPHKAISQMLHPKIVTLNGKIGFGLPASPGAAVGRIALTSEEVQKYKNDGVILIRNETSTEDIEDMSIANGIITLRGGMTSHAAVVARGLGFPCIVGSEDLEITIPIEGVQTGKLRIGNQTLQSGDFISMDGETGAIYQGKIDMEAPHIVPEFNTIMSIVDKYKKIKIMANADTAQDAKYALEQGAEGIGLCRTEHMFFDSERINLVRAVILSPQITENNPMLLELQRMQEEDFMQLFSIMADLPVTIRLLDPPLHEFLPKSTKIDERLIAMLRQPEAAIHAVIEKMFEANPMLGTRGCRLGVMRPEIYTTQIKAIFQAIYKCKKHDVEIMVPFVHSVEEIKVIKAMVASVAKQMNQKFGYEVHYKLGTMIELPASAIIAGEIAQYVDFFSFGTNDLTQTTLGLSRDDVTQLVEKYREQGIMLHDPFVNIDDTVLELVKMACQKGLAANPSLKLGVCGEHAGDPASILKFASLGLQYLSCSAYRVSTARFVSGLHAQMSK